MFGKKDPLPDPAESVKVPDHLRMPFFKGKTAPPTTILSPETRRAQMAPPRRRSRLAGFFKGLLAGALLIVALDLGGEFIVRYLPDSVRFNPPIPLRALVFISMTAGVLCSALLIFLVLGLQAMGWMLGRGQGGLFGALARGMGRLISATVALGLTLGVFAGTGWFMIPRSDWGRVQTYLQQEGQKGLEKTRSLLK